jgi:hypothetical protein
MPWTESQQRWCTRLICAWRSKARRQSVAAIALGGVSAACVIDQYLPHQLGTDGQEMFPVLKLINSRISLANRKLALHPCRVEGSYLPDLTHWARSQSATVFGQNRTEVPIRK